MRDTKLCKEKLFIFLRSNVQSQENNNVCYYVSIIDNPKTADIHKN